MKHIYFLSIVLLFSTAIFGQESYYRVYQFETPYKGHLELTQWATYIAKSDLPYSHFSKNLSRDKLVAHAIEAEYGVGDHFVLAGYADFEDPKGDHLNFIRSRVEARYRFKERFDNFVNTAMYLEYYMPDHAYQTSNEVEARVILDKDLNDFRIVLNPVVSKYVNGDEDHSWQPGLNAGIYYRRGRVVQPGIEYYTNFHEKTGAILPTLDINIGGSIIWNIGAGFGVNSASDKVIIKSILQVDLEAIRPSKLMRKKSNRFYSFTNGGHNFHRSI